MYREWVGKREAILAGVKYKGEPELDNQAHYYKYGYWLGKDFIDSDMYVDIVNEKILTCEFRGLIACSRWYKKYNKTTKKYDYVTFITIGYKNSIYIDITVKGWIGIKNKNICSGKGKLKLLNGYASINTDEITYK